MTFETKTLAVVVRLRVSVQPYHAVTDFSGDFLYVSSTADVLTTKNPDDQHGETSQLSDPEIQNVVAFRLSLEEAESRIEDLRRLD